MLFKVLNLALFLCLHVAGDDPQILKAYETLSDPILRQNYDLGGMNEVRTTGEVQVCTHSSTVNAV